MAGISYEGWPAQESRLTALPSGKNARALSETTRTCALYAHEAIPGAQE